MGEISPLGEKKGGDETSSKDFSGKSPPNSPHLEKKKKG
jgi:hypothetical protein